MLTKNDLGQFTGTENYYKNFLGLKYTDGVKYLCENGKAYWLIDAIASYQHEKKIRGNPRLMDMQFWKLKVNLKEGTAVLTCREDDGIPPVITQKIEYTDFEMEEVDVWVQNGVALLPSEY